MPSIKDSLIINHFLILFFYSHSICQQINHRRNDLFLFLMLNKVLLAFVNATF